MSKIDLDPITSGYNLSKINANFQKVEDELNNKVLYRNSPTGEPNSMSSNLDMNGNKILNVVTGTGPSDLATRGYVDEEIAEERVYVDQQLYLVNSELDTKYDKTGGPVFGDINLNGHKLIGASEVQTSKTSTSILEINGVPVIPGNSVIDPYNGTREALRRSYAEAGYNLVDGSFEAGGTLVNANDVLLQERTGKAFSGPAGDVAPGTDPTLPGSGYVPRTDVTLRSDLNVVVKVFESVASMYADATLIVGQKCRTLGYYALGDGGGNHYEIVVAATGTDDGGSFIDLDNGLQAKGLFLNNIINVRQFGAKGDGISDDASALNNCINFCRTFKADIQIKAGSYLCTKSINMTSNGSRPITLVGEGKLTSNLIFDLDEPYPALDATDNKRGGIYNLNMYTKTTSLDTCTLLLAETMATGMNLFRIDECHISNYSDNAKASLVGICSDQLQITNSEVRATGLSAEGGFVLDGSNKLGIVSKYKTIGLFGSDLTYISGFNSQFVAGHGPAIDITGYTEVSMITCYFADLVAGSSYGMVRLKGNGRAVHPKFINCRSENQSPVKTTPVFYIEDGYIENGEFSGTYTAGVNGAMFAGPGSLYQCKIDASVGANPLFDNFGPLIDCTLNITGGSRTIGTVANISSWANLTCIGRVATLPELLGAFSTIPGLKIQSAALSTSTSSKMVKESLYSGVIFPRADSPLNYRKGFSSGTNVLSVSSYTGGSGFQQVASLTVSPAILYSTAAAGDLGLPHVDIELFGEIASTAEVNGTITLTLTQGVNTLTLATLGSIPAGAGGFKVLIRLMKVGSTALMCMSELEYAPSGTGGTKLGSITRANPTAYNMSAEITDNFIVGLKVNNSGSNPIGNVYAYLVG